MRDVPPILPLGAVLSLGLALGGCTPPPLPAAEPPADDEDLLTPGAPDLAAAEPEDLSAPDPGRADLARPADLAPVPDAGGCPAGGRLKPGESFVVAVDRFTGDEATTQPKADKNDGKDGDDPYFQRNNVARGHLDYWFTSKHREAGEPDPKGPQWVDYRPPLTSLGAGRYHVTAQYRQTDNRAPYEALYIVTHRGGMTTVKRDQRLGSGYVNVELGDFDLGCAGWVRVQDPGSDSISFNKMVFKYLGP